MILTDTHTHLYSEAFDPDQNEMIERALKAGVKRFFVPAIDSTYTNRMYALQAKFPDHIFLMMGLHPTHVKDNYKEELRHVMEQLAQHKFYAIGEIGIDLYWDKTFLRQQMDAMHLQIGLAKSCQLPIVIHCREAFDQVFEVLEQHKGTDLRGIFHCFTGDYSQALKAIDLNLKLGIGGVVTFKNGKIDQFLNKIPIEHIVLETDSPYLAPKPYRGKRNESAYLPYVLEKIASVYNLPPHEVAAITTANSKTIFGI